MAHRHTAVGPCLRMLRRVGCRPCLLPRLTWGCPCAAHAQILTPVQEARIVVDAHPYIVNALALCTAVAEAAGAPTAELRMSDLMARADCLSNLWLLLAVSWILLLSHH